MWNNGRAPIGTASPPDETVRELGAVPVDYRAPDMYEQIERLAGGGVDAVFGHVGGKGLVRSWRLLKREGALVSYGTAATKDDDGNSQLPVPKLLARLLACSMLPNGRSVKFYNLWSGRRRPQTFRRRLAQDLTQVFRLLSTGALVPQITAEIPLPEAASALRLAASRTVAGKVVIMPGA